ncbi:HD domain-containing protein [Desulfosarcina cetonica]|uniref:HD domain-containing protein n=1 Tax=Desulfosarcina cetonica TaxID=90730 RepID=UPI001FEE43B9|nr:HD domain-containing protein [Desulfosarcina cetonica]
MTGSTPTRQAALTLLKTYNQSDSLIKHAYAVEGVMRYMARKYGEDEETWGIVGLIHDLDYEQFPDQHCAKTEDILRQNQWPEHLIRAVVSMVGGSARMSNPNPPWKRCSTPLTS